jgi:hypothetical protein
VSGTGETATRVPAPLAVYNRSGFTRAGPGSLRAQRVSYSWPRRG